MLIHEDFAFDPIHTFECGQCFRWNCNTDGVYIGDWSNNMRHGEGFLRLANGKFFDGQFYNDQQVE